MQQDAARHNTTKNKTNKKTEPNRSRQLLQLDEMTTTSGREKDFQTASAGTRHRALHLLHSYRMLLNRLSNSQTSLGAGM